MAILVAHTESTSLIDARMTMLFSLLELDSVCAASHTWSKSSSSMIILPPYAAQRRSTEREKDKWMKVFTELRF